MARMRTIRAIVAVIVATATAASCGLTSGPDAEGLSERLKFMVDSTAQAVGLDHLEHTRESRISECMGGFLGSDQSFFNITIRVADVDGSVEGEAMARNLMQRTLEFWEGRASEWTEHEYDIRDESHLQHSPAIRLALDGFSLMMSYSLDPQRRHATFTFEGVAPCADHE